MDRQMRCLENKETGRLVGVMKIEGGYYFEFHSRIKDGEPTEPHKFIVEDDVRILGFKLSEEATLAMIELISRESEANLLNLKKDN